MATEYDDSYTPTREEIKDDITAKARAAGQQAADEGKVKAEQYSAKTAETLEDVAAVAEDSAEELEMRGQTTLSHYISEVAEGIDSLAQHLKGKSADDLIHEASDLARRNTGLFFLGSVAIGFGLSRFAKASYSKRRQKQSSADQLDNLPASDAFARKDYVSDDALGGSRSFSTYTRETL